MKNLDTSIGAPLAGSRAGGRVNAYADRIHNSRQWRDRTRPDKLMRDPLCQRCLYRGTVVRAVHVDHWTPLDLGGAPYDDRNLVSLCASCHGEKTRLEQDGKPYFEIVPSAEREYTVA